MPTSTRPVQVSILTTLNRYVDKLALLKVDHNQTTEKDKEILDTICGTLLKILRYAIGNYNENLISKMTDNNSIYF